MRIIKKPVPNFFKGRKSKILGICIHIGEGDSHQIYSTFLNEEKSAHYCVNQDGSVWEFVSPENTAWHAGSINRPTAKLLKDNPNLSPNDFLIGIEHEGWAKTGITQLQYNTTASLVKDLSQRFNFPMDNVRIITHHSIRFDKTCPGKYVDVNEIIKRANDFFLKEKVVTDNLEQQLNLLQRIYLFLLELWNRRKK